MLAQLYSAADQVITTLLCLQLVHLFDGWTPASKTVGTKIITPVFNFLKFAHSTFDTDIYYFG